MTDHIRRSVELKQDLREAVYALEVALDVIDPDNMAQAFWRRMLEKTFDKFKARLAAIEEEDAQTVSTIFNHAKAQRETV